MNKPIKPVAPSKPQPPDKKQKVNQYIIDVNHLFFKDKYYMPDPDDESADMIEVDEKDWDSEVGERERDNYVVSIEDIMKLCPGIVPNQIMIDMHIGTNRLGDDIIDRCEFYYQTKFDYDLALEEYKKDLEAYKIKLVKYTEATDQYKKDWTAYQVEQESVRMQKKKAKLEAELSKLNKP